MNQNKFKFLTILVVILVLFACGTITLNKAPTQTQIVSGMYQVYNAQHKDYMSMAANPATTEAQKQILRKKKPILDKLGTLIPMYDAAIQTKTATPTQQQQIMDLLNLLEQL